MGDSGRSVGGMRFSDKIEDYPEGIVLPIDKPYRWTSADVVRKVKYAAKRHFGKKNLKVGHAGTLDPLATGILLVCIGPATKKAEELQASPKAYVAGVSFGATTPSFDREKSIDKVCPLDGVSREALERVLPAFLGEQEQVAPLFSAKSVDGVRAYETARRLLRQAAREGVEFDHSAAELLQTNRINIYSLKVLEWQSAPLSSPQEDVEEDPKHPRLMAGGAHEVGGMNGSEGPKPQASGGEDGAEGSGDAPRNEPSGRINVADVSGYNLPTAMVEVHCSKGTYIRALARDMGEALGSGAFLSSLRRTLNGGFTIEQAITLDEALRLLD